MSPVHNAVAVLRFTSYAAAGGRVRVQMRPAGGEATTVAEWEVPAGKWTTHTVTQPLNGAGFLDGVALDVEHRSHKKWQSIETRLLAAYSRNTLKASEAPDEPAGRSSDTGTADPTLPAETGTKADDDTSTSTTDTAN